MSEYQPSDIRVSDSEREDALGKLGEHMSAGRLDIDEYGERSVKVTTAKTRGELLDLFGDLPEPKPAFGRPAPPAPPAPTAPAGRAPSFVQKVGPALIPIAAVIAAFSLMFLVKLPFFFLLPFIFIAVSSSRWRGYDQQRREAQRQAMRANRDAMRDYHRQMHRPWRDERY
ncbi:MAG TPA: DUF1707 domain-containing protein [Actinophytocola sp.]|nr:DUF1707 domain-containing protein [Actinophytocola sp.]